MFAFASVEIMSRRPVSDRLWAKVTKAGPRQPHMLDECWEWTGCMNSHGYGNMRDERSRMDACHRISWRLANGNIPEGLQVCHHCDNRRCVRPSHMFLGTILDNMRDRNAKGRQWHPRGELQGGSKLTSAQVAEIKARYARGCVRQDDLATEFRVSRSNIGLIVRGKNWPHIKAESIQ